jgi:hypothetical protein
MNPKKMLTSLIPWVAFSLIVERGGGNAAVFGALAAVAIAAVLLVRSRADGVKVLDVAGVGTFVALAVMAAAGSDSLRDQIANYGRGGSTLVLAAVMLGSVIVLPFTEQYARESVPRQYWNSPVFRSVNRRISLVWGAAVLVMGCGHLFAGHLQADGNSSGNNSLAVKLVLNWGVPAALALTAMAFTNRISGTNAPAAA